MNPTQGLIILTLSLFLRRVVKGKGPPAPPRGTPPPPPTAPALPPTDLEDDARLEAQVECLDDLEGTDMDQVRLSDILSAIESATLASIASGP